MGLENKNQFSALRKDARLSLEETADFLRLPLSEAKKMEQGTLKPSVSNVLALQGAGIVAPRVPKKEVEYQTIGELFSGPGGGAIGPLQ